MKPVITALLLACAAMLASTAEAQTAAASDSTSASTPASRKAVKKGTKKATPAKEEDEPEPDIAGTTVFEYQCELGAKLTVYQNNDDAEHVALKWGKRVHRLARIPTTTGADRFENKHYGLVWIAIPAKGILLDSKTGHQLANDCHTPEQRAEAAETAQKAALAEKAAEAADKAATAAQKAAAAADKAAEAAQKAADAAQKAVPTGQGSGK